MTSSNQGLQGIATLLNYLSATFAVRPQKYSGQLITRQVWYSNGQKCVQLTNGPVYKCHLNAGLNLMLN